MRQEREDESSESDDTDEDRPPPGTAVLDLPMQDWKMSPCVLVNSKGWARHRRNPVKKYRKEGSFPVPAAVAKGASLRLAPFPHAKPPVTSLFPKVQRPFSNVELQEALSQISSFADCVTPEALVRITEIRSRILKDEDALRRGSSRKRMFY